MSSFMRMVLTASMRSPSRALSIVKPTYTAIMPTDRRNRSRFSVKNALGSFWD